MPKSLNFLLILSVIILLGAGCSKTALKTTDETADSPATETAPITVGVLDEGGVAPEALIEYIDGEYNPSILRVISGTKVTFVNKGETPVWPKSDSELCPGFDAAKRIITGETYSYIFTGSGECAFYNQLAPGEKGLVDVKSAQ